MDVVYAITRAMIPTETGGSILVIDGTHWLASDPIVRRFPEMFTSNPLHPRAGLCASVPLVPQEDSAEVAPAAPAGRRKTA